MWLALGACLRLFRLKPSTKHILLNTSLFVTYFFVVLWIKMGMFLQFERLINIIWPHGFNEVVKCR